MPIDFAKSRHEQQNSVPEKFSLRLDHRETLDSVSENASAAPAVPSRSSARTGGRSALKPKQASADPQLLIIRATYLSGLQAPGWFERPTSYLLSVHAGDEARGDPPKKPGKHSTQSVPAAAPRMVAPEEMELRQRIESAVTEMISAAGGGSVGGHECRFNSWITVRLADCGPGPAAGGPAYFRVDVWADKISLFGQAERAFFGRVFVPLHNPEWQRRPCTWPVVNEAGKDLAYLTCEFAFGHAPDAVRQLQVDSSTSSQVNLSWRPPRVRDEAVPILGYSVEGLALHRGQHPQADSEASGFSNKPPSPSKEKEAWQNFAEVEVSAEPCCMVTNLKRDTRYRFRVCAVNQAGVGDIAEVEAVTGPGAPGMCGPPRLASCCQQVLTIEWTPPTDDGGVPIESYWLWVRPYSAMCAMDSASIVDGQVRHVEGEPTQRADIHTDELNPSVGRYLCSVAALNAAGEVGPPTPDVNSLPFPNPCAVCGPSMQAVAAFSAQQLGHGGQAAGLGQPLGYPAVANDQMDSIYRSAEEVRESGPNGYGLARSPQSMQEQSNYRMERPASPVPEDPVIRSYAAAYRASDADVVQRSAPAYKSQQTHDNNVPIQRPVPDYDADVQRSAPVGTGILGDAADVDYGSRGWEYPPTEHAPSWAASAPRQPLDRMQGNGISMDRGSG